jgi:Sensors of blue-light using FAD
MNVDESQDDEKSGGFILPKLFNLVYCSRAAAGMDAASVEGIIAVAQRQNAIYGITGLLVFGSGVFFQWLEGPRDRVTQLMDNIKRDQRHDTIVALSENEEVGERLFPDWDMELVNAEDIREVLEDAISTAEDKNSLKALRRLRKQIDQNAMGQGEK